MHLQYSTAYLKANVRANILISNGLSSTDLSVLWLLWVSLWYCISLSVICVCLSLDVLSLLSLTHTHTHTHRYSAFYINYIVRSQNTFIPTLTIRTHNTHTPTHRYGTRGSENATNIRHEVESSSSTVCCALLFRNYEYYLISILL